MRFFKLLILFISLTISSQAQHITIKIVSLQDKSSIPHATVTRLPSDEIFIANDFGCITMEASLFEKADSIIAQHVSFSHQTILPSANKPINDTIIIALTEKFHAISEVTIRHESIKQITSKMIGQWEKKKYKDFRSTLGVFSTYISQSDSLCYSLVSDAIGLWGGNKKEYYTKYGFEIDHSHFSIIPLGTSTNKNFSTLQLGHTGPEVLTSRLRVEDLSWAEKFLYDHGPLVKQYRKYYDYTLDSTFTDNQHIKHYSISFKSKAKANKKNILRGTGQLVINSDYELVQARLVNPSFPIIYKHNGVHYRNNDSMFKQQIEITYTNVQDTIFPVRIQVNSSYGNGRTEYAQYTSTGLISSLFAGIERTERLVNFFKSGVQNLLLPPSPSSTPFKDEVQRFKNRYQIELYPISERIWFHSHAQPSWPKEHNKHLNDYQKIVEALWEEVPKFY